MVNLCVRCSKPLQDKDKVTFPVKGTYRFIKSTNAWAIDKSDLQANSDEIAHVKCPAED